MWTSERVLKELVSILTGAEISREAHTDALVEQLGALHPLEQAHMLATVRHPDVVSRQLAGGIASRLNQFEATPYPSATQPDSHVH